MKTLLAFCFLLPAALMNFSYQEKPKLSALYALEGTWGMSTKRGMLYESWNKLNRDELRGNSYRLNGADTVVLERISLVENRDGIFYIPIVEDQNNRQPVSFKLISVNGNTYVFENKLHDFPQRIIYNFVSSDSIVAHIEGLSKGKMAKSSYHYKRVR